MPWREEFFLANNIKGYSFFKVGIRKSYKGKVSYSTEEFIVPKGEEQGLGCLNELINDTIFHCEYELIEAN